MDQFINAVLLIVGTALASLSYFGKPAEEKKGWRRLFTVHGGMTTALWILALSFGLWKEHRTEASDANKQVQSRAEADQAKSAADARQADLTARLNEANKETASANGALNELRGEMGYVRHDLSQARNDAKDQSAANLITSLANSDQRVHEVSVIVPFTSRARKTNSVTDAFLPSLPKGACRDLTGVQTGLFLGAVVHGFPVERFNYTPGQVITERQIKNADLPKADAMLRIETPEDAANAKIVLTILKQKSFNNVVYAAAVKPTAENDSAAQLFGALMKNESIPFTIIVQWPAWYPSAKENDAQFTRYPDLLGKAPTVWGGNPFAEFPDKHHPVPKQCSALERRYLEAAFSKAMLSIDIGTQQDESVLFPLTAKKPYYYGSGVWGLDFRVSSAPSFAASKEFQNIVDVDPKPGQQDKKP